MSSPKDDRIWQTFMVTIGVMVTILTSLVAWMCGSTVDLIDRTARIEERVNAINLRLSQQLTVYASLPADAAGSKTDVAVPGGGSVILVPRRLSK